MSKIKQALPEGFSVLDKPNINQILIYEPRWHRKDVLIADRRLMPQNEVIIAYPSFSKSYYITDKQARQYPSKRMKTKAGYYITMRQIPLDDLEKEVLDV